MRKFRFLILLLFIVATTLSAASQQRSVNLTIKATALAGESLQGQEVDVYDIDYALSYEKIYLDANGGASIKIYPGNNRVTISRQGYAKFSQDFNATADLTVNAQLTEDVQTPFALNANVAHNVFDGTNHVTLSWNKEAPVFFDDFESYTPFSISFGDWTGIDGDGVQAAPLQGDYSNRGALMYAQIINPLKVVPSWWADYPVLRPYSGQQYAGFIRTTTGVANDDWLISPVITPGNHNFLSFMAKAGDVGKERFQVYVTETTSDPQESDFTQINQGNYEQVDYKAWQKFSYDLSSYAGRPIRFAIRYISAASTEKTFMLMVDDVQVAQDLAANAGAKSKRVAQHSPQNPNESFELYLDGSKVGQTDGYSYDFGNLTDGEHTLGVKAVYKQAQSSLATTMVSISNEGNVRCTLAVAANNGLSLDGNTISITSESTGQQYDGIVANGEVSMKSLPKGSYLISANLDNYNAFSQSFNILSDTTINVELKEKIINPYNVTATSTADANGTFSVALRWNQLLSFTDDFESYDNFAQHLFGSWKSIDLDGGTVYPIGLGSSSNIVTFPGASTPSNPTAIAPIVFNAYATVPAMLPSDVAMTPTSGQKEILFFSPQGKKADKWLISPQLDIRDGYVLRVAAKSYSNMYPESLEFCVSTTDSEVTSFTTVSTANQMDASQWNEYETDLSAFAGKKVYVGIHYVTYDGFFAQLDDFYVGSSDGSGETVDVGAVKNYDIYLDGSLKGTATEPSYTLTAVEAGKHTAGIQAHYATGASEVTQYDFVAGESGIGSVDANQAEKQAVYYTIDGRSLGTKQPTPGIYIRKAGSQATKVIIK